MAAAAESIWRWFRRQTAPVQVAGWLLVPYIVVLVLILKSDWPTKTKLGVIGGLVALGLAIGGVVALVSPSKTSSAASEIDSEPVVTPRASSPSSPQAPVLTPAPVPNPPPTPSASSPSSPQAPVLTAACAQDFSIAASIDAFQDTIEDLDPALTDCKSIEEWVLADAEYPRALDGVSPRTFLKNRCHFGGPALKKTFLCEVRAGIREPIFASSPGTVPETHPFFRGEVTNFIALDEANLRVFLRLSNSGNEADKGECTITAYDASNRIVGFDVFASRDQIKPKGFLILRGAIRIEDEGAFRVRRVKASDCGVSN